MKDLKKLIKKYKFFKYKLFFVFVLPFLIFLLGARVLQVFASIKIRDLSSGMTDETRKAEPTPVDSADIHIQKPDFITPQPYGEKLPS